MVNRDEIRRRRIELEFTLQEAGERAGFSGRQRWSGIEQGERSNPSVTTMAAVARALGCTIEDLLLPPVAKKRKSRKR